MSRRKPAPRTRPEGGRFRRSTACGKNRNRCRGESTELLQPGDLPRLAGQDRCKVAIQSNNVETDDRGYVYVVDRANTGLAILELTPDGKKAAGVE